MSFKALFGRKTYLMPAISTNFARRCVDICQVQTEWSITLHQTGYRFFYSKKVLEHFCTDITFSRKVVLQGLDEMRELRGSPGGRGGIETRKSVFRWNGAEGRRKRFRLLLPLGGKQGIRIGQDLISWFCMTKIQLLWCLHLCVIHQFPKAAQQPFGVPRDEIKSHFLNSDLTLEGN